MQVPNNPWIVLCNLQNFRNRSTLLFLWRSGDNNWFLTYRKLNNLLLFPHPFAFAHHVHLSPYFRWFCIYSCRFPRCSTFIQPFTNFPGYPWRGSHTTQSCPSVHGEPFSFSQFVFIKLFNFQVAHLSMLDAGGQEGYCDYQVRKAFYNFYMDLPVALVNPDWDQWKIEAPQVGVRYPLVRILFLFISFISDFIFVIERMEFVWFWHLLAQPYRTHKVAGCRGHTTSPFVHSWSTNAIRRVSAHMCCLSCCTGPLWAWYPGNAVSSISCQVAACHPPSHGKSFNQWFLCYSLFNYFLGCLQVRFPAGLLSSGLQHSRLQVPL